MASCPLYALGWRPAKARSKLSGLLYYSVPWLDLTGARRDPVFDTAAAE